jgi:hypothetical protein
LRSATRLLVDRPQRGTKTRNLARADGVAHAASPTDQVILLGQRREADVVAIETSAPG